MCTFNWPHIERQYNWSTDTHKPQVFRRIIGLTTSLPLSTAHTDDDYTTQLIRKLLSKPRHELCLKRVPYFYHNRDIFPRIHHLLSSTTPKHISRAYIERSRQNKPAHPTAHGITPTEPRPRAIRQGPELLTAAAAAAAAFLPGTARADEIQRAAAQQW